MSRTNLNSILDRVFQSNPAYELAPFDRLTPDQQTLLKGLTNDPDFYGVLLSREDRTTPVRSVCRDAALLIQSMTQPGSLPLYVRRSSDENTNQAVAELVLDGILEIGHEGGFFSGAGAYSLICAGAATPEPHGILPKLSQAALEYAQELSIHDAARLSMRLYGYNRLPINPQWTRRLASEQSVLEFLGIANSSKTAGGLRDWSLIQEKEPSKVWFEWFSQRRRPMTAAHNAGYKLYVSPRPEKIPAAFQAVVEILDGSGVHAFKVGRNAANLLRPDKLVIYFHDFDSLQQTAAELSRTLRGCEAHGVPFTAPISDDGLLSWGIDPVPEKGMLASQGPESWRLWITNRLALSLVSAQRQRQGTMEPWRFALERLRLDEIDVNTWTPTANFGTAA